MKSMGINPPPDGTSHPIVTPPGGRTIPSVSTDVLLGSADSAAHYTSALSTEASLQAALLRARQSNSLWKFSANSGTTSGAWYQLTNNGMVRVLGKTRLLVGVGAYISFREDEDRYVYIEDLAYAKEGGSCDCVPCKLPPLSARLLSLKRSVSRCVVSRQGSDVRYPPSSPLG